MFEDAHSTPRLLRFKKIHYYLVPAISLIVWWGMLIAMLTCWGAQGRPIYKFMGGVHQDPVYISDIGATNLQPLFIACAGFQGIFFVGTLLLEYILRRKIKLQPYVSNKQPIFAIVSIVCAVIGQLGILFTAIFNTNNFHNVHFSMVGIFIAGSFLACLFNDFNTFIFGNFPSRLCPNHERVFFGQHKWANLYMVSFFMKVVWLCLAVVFAVCFGALMYNDELSPSAAFEWAISFWYGFVLVMWAIDLFPSAVKHYQIRHPEMYPAYDNHTGTYMGAAHEKNDQNSSTTTSDHGTYVNAENNHLINHDDNFNQNYRGPVESGPSQDVPTYNSHRYNPNAPHHIKGPSNAEDTLYNMQKEPEQPASALTRD
ncbi:hypothetical protein HYPBUDRAFT_154294 [Hyphopichia burtonii NRRL Y-1933]|uniref:CWH43-like N-terminal domain-containing protein n=1 Tax=Hyphopichia burtonii NRRL Y-1933 TaxID=984485 RepID=A0A1E4RBR1_9ASCO|nr:hypothetical protein HYPBUDRAFT_154294 [Hyphopichia burtonii NRRL Y-1933]ODV64690.1 hypothetical protein HYPBUDRAFT_154294 [Hyphopichia burtonii NRRL Y-1933]